MSGIVSDESVRSGEPRVDGTRITVLDVKRRVMDADEEPRTVADEYGLTMAQVFQALAFYYDNVEEMETRERNDRSFRTAGETRTAEVLGLSTPDAGDAEGSVD